VNLFRKGKLVAQPTVDWVRLNQLNRAFESIDRYPEKAGQDLSVEPDFDDGHSRPAV
jgi:hypothetical protein